MERERDQMQARDDDPHDFPDQPEVEDLNIRLKTAIDINELRDEHGQGTVFEIDPSSVDPGPDDAEYDRDMVFKNLSYTAQGLNSDGESDSEADEAAPFDKLRKRMVDITQAQDGGVMKKILQPGSGRVVPKLALVTFHMNGYLEFADEPYDSTRLRNEEYRKKLGKGELLPGLEIGIESMKRGELAQFLIRCDYGYGKLGIPPRIPPDSELLLEVELLNFVEHDGVDEFFRRPISERKEADFDEVLKVANAKKHEGKQCFLKNKFRSAAALFEKAIKVVEGARLKDDRDEQRQQNILIKLYLNMAVTCGKLNSHRRCIHFCNETLYYDPKNAKALYHKGKALRHEGDFGKAKEMLEKAKKLMPYDEFINKELKELGQEIQKHNQTNKEFYMKMFNPQKAGDDSKESTKPVEERNPNQFCSEDFKDLVRDKLQSFLEDDSAQECPFPAGVMALAETAFIADTAKSMGLDVIVKGKADAVVVRIVKPDKT